MLLNLVVFALLVGSIVSPPVDKAHPKVDKDVQHVNETIEHDPVLQLEYHKYLKEVVSVLESDPEFKKLIDGASVDDIKSGKIASHLEMVNHNIRTKLDELKRQEIDRLRVLILRKAKLNQMNHNDVKKTLDDLTHLNHEYETFEVGDLEKLIRQATVDLEEVDKLRREQFKEHEIEKEYERREKLSHLDAAHKKQAEEEFQKEQEKRKHHEKINHPGSRDQLKEVWEEQDHLEPERFDPNTFFQLHDLDGNRYLDEFEVESLFQIELNKIYNSSDANMDPEEREEDANRMREHVYNELDTNKDRMISFEEFKAGTQQKDFNTNEEWKSVEDEPQFDQQEYENYSRDHHPSDANNHLPDPIQLQQQHPGQFQQQQPPQQHPGQQPPQFQQPSHQQNQPPHQQPPQQQQHQQPPQQQQHQQPSHLP